MGTQQRKKTSYDQEIHDWPNMTHCLTDLNFWNGYEWGENEWQMQMASSVHHTNPRSATLDFWRKTTKYDEYKVIPAKRRAQMNKPTSSGLNKEDHIIIAQRLGEMEKRRVGTRFIDREATEEDQAKPLMQILAEQGINCSII